MMNGFIPRRTGHVTLIASFRVGCTFDRTVDRNAPGLRGRTGPINDGGPQASGTSGVTGSKTIATATTADKIKICDWTASLYGGYGKTINCTADLTVSGPADQASCLAEAAMISATCTATVAQAESCTKTIASCSDATTADCTALLSCYM